MQWEVSFGAGFGWEVDIRCPSSCDGQQVYYQTELLLKTPDGLTNLSGADTSYAFYHCNRLVSPRQTLYTRRGEASRYAIGDTVMYRFFAPRLCSDINGLPCQPSTEDPPAGLPDYTFEYVLTTADFDCG